MATTGRLLITDALQDLGVLAAGEVPDADDAVDVLRRLNALASSWNLEPVDWNFPTFDLDTDVTLADGVERALVAALGVEIAPMFGVRVPEEAVKRAYDAKAAVKRPQAVTIPLRADPGALQTSDRRYGFDIRHSDH